MAFESWKRPDVPCTCTFSLSEPNAISPHHHTTGLPHPKVASSVLDVVGKTPMVRLNRIPQSEGIECEVWVKCEFMNPGGSVKDRIAKRMIEEGERSGLYKPGDRLIEPTSGNTGIGIALVAAVKGYKCTIVLPDKMSQEKCRVLRLLGADLVRTPRAALLEDPESNIRTAATLKHSLGDSAHIPDQYSNAYNPIAHYETTAPEILEACAEGEPDGQPRLDMIVLGAGTGGTLTGIGRRLKQRLPKCQGPGGMKGHREWDNIQELGQYNQRRIVAVEPNGSNLADDYIGLDSYQGPYEVEGIGYDFIPTVLELGIVDHWIRVNDNAAFNMARRLIREEGLLVGGSCGSAMAAAIEAIKRAGLGKQHRVVVVLPDSIRNYMTKYASDDWMYAFGYMSFPAGEPFVKPWFDMSVGDFLCKAAVRKPVYLDENCSIRESVEKTDGNFAIITKEFKVVAVFNAQQALQNLLKGSSEPTCPVISVADKEFKQVFFSDKVEKLARLLAYYQYVVALVDERDKGALLVRPEDMLTFSTLTTKDTQ